MEKNQNLSIFILAGGKSSRFQKDKALFPYRGKPLIEHVIDAVKPISGVVSIIANDTERFKYLQIPCYPDIIEGFASLGGLYTALHYCSTEIALVLGCDMPDLNPDLLSYMVSVRDDYDIVVPYVKGWYEPLHAVYSVRCLPVIEANIQTGKRQIINFFESMRIRRLIEDEIRLFTDPGTVFRNINYPKDIEDPSDFIN